MLCVAIDFDIATFFHLKNKMKKDNITSTIDNSKKPRRYIFKTNFNQNGIRKCFDQSIRSTHNNNKSNEKYYKKKKYKESI